MNDIAICQQRLPNLPENCFIDVLWKDRQNGMFLLLLLYLFSYYQVSYNGAEGPL